MIISVKSPPVQRHYVLLSLLGKNGLKCVSHLLAQWSLELSQLIHHEDKNPICFDESSVPLTKGLNSHPHWFQAGGQLFYEAELLTADDEFRVNVDKCLGHWSVE